MTAYAIFIRERSRNAAELQTYAELVTPLLGGIGSNRTCGLRRSGCSRGGRS